MSISKLSAVWLVGSLCSCVPSSPNVSGSAFLDVHPKGSPGLVGNYGFELLEPVRGKACLTKPKIMDRTIYWIGGFPFETKVPKDELTAGAIAAASIDAIDKITAADTILVTRVITEGKARKEVCAYVYGRAVRLTKAEQPPQHSKPEPARPPAPSDDDDN